MDDDTRASLSPDLSRQSPESHLLFEILVELREIVSRLDEHLPKGES